MRRTLYSHTLDVLICPVKGTPPHLHQEDKSWSVFDTYALEVLTLAQHIEDGQLGTSLVLVANEEGAQSIIMKVSHNYLMAKSAGLTSCHYF